MVKGGIAFITKKGFEKLNEEAEEKAQKDRKAAEYEALKIQELQLEKAQQRKLEEFLKNGGAVNQEKEDKIGWMYQHGLTNDSAEEYLLGKTFKMVGDAVTSENPLLPSTSLSSLPQETPLLGGSNYKKQAQKSNNNASKLREDPLMAIMKQEQVAKNNIISNPVTMAKIKSLAGLPSSLVSKNNDGDNARDRDRDFKNKYTRDDSRDSRREDSRDSRRDDSRSSSYDRRNSDRDRRSHRSKSRSPVRGVGKYGLLSSQPKNNSRSTSSMSAEEKARRLAAMMKDAEDHDSMKQNIVDRSRREDDASSSRPRDPGFLANMQREVINNSSVTEQVSRNKHYHDRNI